jgi:hypothetical protein
MVTQPMGGNRLRKPHPSNTQWLHSKCCQTVHGAQAENTSLASSLHATSKLTAQEERRVADAQWQLQVIPRAAALHVGGPR